jgi:hypothetical protein
MKIYNMMTCGNLGTEVLSTCSIAWLGLVILFFVAAFANKWLGKEMDIPFNFIVSLIVGFLVYVLIMTFTGSARWSIVAGLIGEAAGGFLGGMSLGSGPGGEDSGGSGGW